MTILQISVLVCIVITLLVFIHSYYSVTFLSSKQTSEFFRLDPDGYLKQMSEYDIKARGANTKTQMMNRIINATENFSLYEKFNLILCTRLADIFFKRLDTLIPYVNCRQIANIPWILAKTKDNMYEGGYPHTRENIIFITNKTIYSGHLVKTLIHEKVHLWQRMYPEEMQKWIRNNNWQPHSSRYQYPMIRSNPDTDSIVYTDPNGKLGIVEYLTKNPKSIRDTKFPIENNPVSEHPNETLAYYIDYLYSIGT